jgi:peptide chain release factor 1
MHVWRNGGDFSLEVLDERPGALVLRASGSTVAATFANESGGHRWQRVPPTERSGRVHTSTITVAVMAEPSERELVVQPSDLRWVTRRGTGPGGQHRNKTESAVELTHLPTGLVVRCQSERSQLRNKQSALAVLRARLQALSDASEHATSAADRRRQVGSGMRGDKRRTIRIKDGQVHDHVTGQRWNATDYLRGEW